LVKRSVFGFTFKTAPSVNGVRCKSTQFTDVGITLDLVAPGVRLLHFLSQNGVVHIAQRDQPRAFQLAQSSQMILAPPIKTYDLVSNVSVRAGYARLDGGLRGQWPGFIGRNGQE